MDVQQEKRRLFIAIWAIENETGKIDQHVAKKLADAFYKLGVAHANSNTDVPVDAVGHGKDQQ